MNEPDDLKGISNKWMLFEEVPNPGKKTRVILAVNRNGGYAIAKIKWFPRWRQYCFFPLDGTVYNSDCLRGITEAVDTLNRTHGRDR